jgi:ABC-type lipoprotein export system ATPase subunit
MCGILWPTEGEVKVFGTDIYALSDTDLVKFRLKNIGFIFQQYNLIPSIDVASNAAVPLIAQGVPREEARERAKVLLDKLNIGNQADKLPRQLSGGQQQRVAIARALVHEPRLVVCDEPTAALDASSGRRVMDLLREVAVAPDRACIIVTHDNRIFDLADRIIVLEDGLLVSTSGSLEYLKHYGFETFNDVFDESYDKELDPILRLEKIIKLMKHIKNLTASEKTQLYDIASRNKQRFFSAQFQRVVVDEFTKNLDSALGEMKKHCLGSFLKHHEQYTTTPWTPSLLMKFKDKQDYQRLMDYVESMQVKI